MDEKVIVLDFGGQYSQLIARRIREAGVYCEILSYDSDLSKLQDTSIKGFIFTGGPHSVYLPASPSCTHKIFDLNRPILGICYGMQVIAHILGGTVEAAEKAEFGRVSISIKEDSSIFSGCCESFDVWMSHNDQVTKPPTGFKVIASSANCAVAAIENSEKKIYGVQFHPEVTHSMYGTKIIENFLYNVCGCSKLWRAENLADTLIEQIKAQAGTQKVIAALSGGVDSSVASVLVHKAIGNNLTCIFVNHGLLRKNEAEEVLTAYKENLGLNIVYVDASARFLNRLKGITNPEEKRKIIGREFIRVFEEEAKKIGGADFLVQGTIYPDVAESGGQKKAAVKSHHNVGGLPENMEFKGLIEPLRQLFKDEVRALGEKLGIPHKLVWRQPFPGPGLAVRILGEITEDKLRLVRESDAILREEITKAGLEESIWQYFTVFPDVRTVGVMGDGRTYDNLIAVRAVTSSDAMTVETAEIPFYILQKISLRIINEVKGINRVVYDITPKPPATIEWE